MADFQTTPAKKNATETITETGEGLHSHICVPVFYGAASLIVLFVLFGALMPGTMDTVFNDLQAWIIDTFGWLYLLSVAVFLVLAVFFATSSLGKVKLGPDDSEPDFTYLSWFAMLFSAGMGIGLMFFGVAEPVMHFNAPPTGNGNTIDAAQEAMRITFFHWGVHAWAIYALIALALAYFGYRYNLPLSIHSALSPIIGDRIHGKIGHIVDIFAILGTMFGVATSLGFGVMQVNAGLNYLFDVPTGITAQVILIGIITLMATTSVVLGLEGGIKKLSNLNLILAAAMLLFVIIAGPTLYIFNVWLDNMGAYISSLVDLTFSMKAYDPPEAQKWMGNWTLFYWAWWIAWSPFVGTFIARISRGRTIREFVIGVMLVPVALTTIWLTAFGNSALMLDMGAAAGGISESVSASIDTALFKFLEHYPLQNFVPLLATILVMTFFVTSSDSGSLVIDIIASGGKENPPVWQRVFWALSEGIVAAILLIAGGLGALQTASITAALPFTFVLLFVCYGLFKALQLEKNRIITMDVPAPTQIRGASVKWQDRLKNIVSHPGRETVAEFLTKTAKPALEKVARELEKSSGLRAEVTGDENHIELTIYHGAEEDFVYGIHIREFKKPAYAFGGAAKRTSVANYCHAEVHLREGGQHYDVQGHTTAQIISDVLSQYERHIHFLHIVR